MEKPLVSIITPSFNSEKFITETIQSVQNQTYKNWEMIIVDDCSTDQTVSIVEEITKKDSRIHLFKLIKNSGTGIARSTALAQASGKFIAFLDADDLWKPEKLDKQLDFMKVNKLPFTFSFYDCINEGGNLLNKRIEAPLHLSYQQLFFCNYIGNLTGIYEANYFGKIAVSPIRKRQDWIQWLTVLKKIKTAQPVPESLAFYRIRENSISASKMELVKHNFAVYRTHHHLNLISATLCMVGFLFTQLILKPRYSKTIKASI
ncbi:glycosyltransferase family 2 protein [Flavobacterium sp. LS1P28]|uniref:glycosyltransferase family 2 protein n=1 Tax=unclassified Flavobacterium TaxID=196869 RepID=UPI000F8383E9|nr:MULTISPECIES: glycosyltransferase family 2 protein [unclassified Flavobacterium]RTY70360.1 glycosyltransferase family 2 protein [Flavobacterium sp. LB2P53]RTY85244.1 glycosyltransferase family 2 protein [Flavobacterium sp. LS1P28]